MVVSVDLGRAIIGMEGKVEKYFDRERELWLVACKCNC